MRFLSILLLFAAFSVNGQVTITRNNFPDIGDKITYQRVLLKNDQIPLALYDTASTDFSIDLSYLDTMIALNDTDYFIPANEADGGGDIKNAEFAFKASFGHGFFNRNGDELQMVGVSPDDPNLPFTMGFQFDKPLLHFNTPINVDTNTTYKDVATASRNLVVVDIKVKVNAEYEVFGEGKMTIPSGKEYDVIRLRRKYVFEVKATPIVGEPTISTDSLITWEFYTPEIPSTILRVDARMKDGDTLWYYDFYHEFLTISKQKVNTELSYKVVQSGSEIIISNANSNKFNASIFDLKGRDFGTKVGASNTCNLSTVGLQPGTYILYIEDSKSTQTKKFVVSR